MHAEMRIGEYGRLQANFFLDMLRELGTEINTDSLILVVSSLFCTLHSRVVFSKKQVRVTESAILPAEASSKRAQ